MSLYKGNMTRSIHILLFHKINTWLTFTAEENFGKYWLDLKKIPILTEFLLSCTVDMILQPLHSAETKFIMQNRTSNFAVYQSLFHFFSSTPIADMFRGCLLHMPRNFLIALSGLKISD